MRTTYPNSQTCSAKSPRPTRWSGVFALLAFTLMWTSALTAQTNRVQAERVFTNDGTNPYRPQFISPDIEKVPAGMSPKDHQRAKAASYNSGSRTSSVVANPDLPASLLCEDLRVIFVLDESASIESSEANLVRTGALALANALNNTGAELSIIEFNTTSSIVNLGSTLVTPSFITAFNNYLYASSGTRYNPTASGNCIGWTNWEDALEDVQTIDADLVIFFTDGNPTAYNVPRNNGCAGGTVTTGGDNSYSSSTALSRAITEANLVKNQGKHMFVAAVGSDLNLNNCKDISGNDNFATTNSIFTADYIVGEFSTLAANLSSVANSICGTELSINKTASASGVCAGERVTFTISVTNTGGDYDFAAYNVVVSDVFPNGYSSLQFVGSAPSGASISGNTLTYNVGTLAANATASVQISAIVDVPPGNYNNIASATADNANQVSDDELVVAGYAIENLELAECTPVTVNGITYSVSGDYQQELVSAAGCDSILNIHFTLLQPSTSSEDVTACDSYAWNGGFYTQSGVYTYNTTNAAGCDSTATLNLTINYSTSSYTEHTACIDYTWNGTTYTSSGIYVYETLNTAGCPNVDSLNLTITPQPEQPILACYQTANWNAETCSYDITGEQPAAPSVLCYETATWNGQTCSYDVTGEQPAAPSVLCYETATWNGTTCSYDVTGEQPAAPSVLCYETATWNGQTCSYDVTGEQPAAPSVLCYETATWNGQTCSYDVTGEQPAAPSVLCYETATWNGQTCSYDITGEQPEMPETSCFEYATFNFQSCAWEINGGQPPMPEVACYETAIFNEVTCAWDVTGEQPAAPSVLCYETATWNGTTCSYDVTGEQPAAPSVLCYETATWNGQTCSYDVTGEQPAAPSVLCYETATWNGQTCSYDVTGEQPAAPSVLCYETATWNGQTCSYDVTGEQPAAPSVLCYETATWNGQTCSYDITGEQPAAPSVLCYETATWNGQTCSYDVTGEQPAAPSVLCYETATWNGTTCSYDVTGEQPIAPSVLCYETATWNGTTCSYDVTGEQPAAPSVLCYETATWNGQTCSYDVTGEPNPVITTNAIECNSYTWSVNGETYSSTGLYTYSADCQDYELNLTINYSSVVTNISASINEGDSYEFDGNSLTEGGTYTAHFENAAGCDSTVVLVLSVTPVITEGCVGASVYAVDQRLTKGGNAVRPERSIASRVLGTPDAQNPPVYAPEQYFFSLGFGGSIEIDFGYNIANGPGNDIKIWESSASPNAEMARIEVSQDGLGYVPVGVVAQGGEVDFGGAFADYVRFVRIVDISNPAQFGNADVSDGYDVDGVECIHGRYVNPACNAVSVLSVEQGKQANGSDVVADRSDVNNALDMPVAAPVGVVDFYALGFGGQITLAFDGPVANGPGADVRIVETTWNYTCEEYPETANVFASQDGVNFVFIGSTCHTGEFDFGPLSWAQYIRIMDASDASLFPADADGYDLNGIECLHGSADQPGDDGLVPCVLQDVLSYNPGKQKNGADIHAMRNNANNALGAPEGTDTYNFVSLGFGGSIELGFDFVVFNTPGNDIQVIETSFGNPSCANYPEHALVAGSTDGVSWTELGELCLDGTVDLGSMTFLQFIRITDISDAGSPRFGASADGFDVDAVVVINGGCYNSGARLAADNTQTPDEATSMGLYPNPADDFTVIRLEGTTADENIVVEVIDAAGRLVNVQTARTQGNETNIRLDLSNYAYGVYTISVTTSNERLVQRLIK